MGHVNTSDTNGSIDAIDFLKVACALLIVNYHTAALEIPYLQLTAKFGFLFNTIFVFLSGYLLAASFALRPVSFHAFLRRRFARIFPAYHVSVLLISVLCLVFNLDISLRGLILAMTGFQYFLGDDTLGDHLWFVAVILSCYALFPLVNIAVRRQPVMVLTVFLLMLLAAGSINASYHDLGLYESISSLRLHRFFYHFFIFAVAVFVGQRWAKNDLLLRPRWIILLAAGVPLFLVDQARGGGVLSLVAVWIVLPGFLALVFFVHQGVSWLSNLLAPLVPITFEIYLVHYVIIAIVATHMKEKVVGYFVVFGVTVIMAFLVSRIAPFYRRVFRLNRA